MPSGAHGRGRPTGGTSEPAGTTPRNRTPLREALDLRGALGRSHRPPTVRPGGRGSSAEVSSVPDGRSGRSGTAPLSVSVTADPGASSTREWDDFVRAHPAGDVAQLSGWGRLRQLAGYRAVFVLVHRGGRLVGGAQVLARHVRGLGTLAYVPYGPLLSPSGAAAPGVHDRLAEELARLGRRRFRMLFVQPPEDADPTATALLDHGFRASDANVAPGTSMRIDLRADEAELRQNLSRRLRTWTNAWPERGVTVRRAEVDDLPLVARLLAATAEHQGFPAFDERYLATMFHELAPSGNLVAFVGEASRHPVAMAVFTGCGEVLKLRLVGLDRSAEGRSLNVPGAVHWTAVRWARQHGYRWFDFGGVDDSSLPALLSGGLVDAEALSGPDRYKSRFGGQVFRYPQPVELIPSAAVRHAYDLSRRSALGRRLAARGRDRARSDGGSHADAAVGSAARPGRAPR